MKATYGINISHRTGSLNDQVFISKLSKQDKAILLLYSPLLPRGCCSLAAAKRLPCSATTPQQAIPLTTTRPATSVPYSNHQHHQTPFPRCCILPLPCCIAEAISAPAILLSLFFTIGSTTEHCQHRLRHPAVTTHPFPCLYSTPYCCCLFCWLE